MCRKNKLNKQKWVNGLSEKALNTKQTILDAFRLHDSSQFAMDERFEEEIFLPNEVTASINDVIVVAANLGALLCPEGRVNIGIHTVESATYLEVDTTKLREASDARAFIIDIRQTTELSRHSVKGPMDIEVTDGKIIPLEESPVWLLVHDGRCVLSVRGECIDSDMFSHLCKVTAFAYENAFNHKVVPAIDILPARIKYELHPRKSVIERIFWHVQNHASNIAIIDDTSSQALTYAELWNASEEVVRQIRKQVTTRKSYPVLAIFMERGWKYLASIIAIQRMVGICVLIDLTHPDDRIRDFLDVSKPDAIITVSSVADRVRSLVEYPVLDFDNKIINQTSTNLEYGKWTETDNEVCFIAGTSGTTGRPKAVCLSYRGMVSTVDAIIDAAMLCENARGSWLSSPGYGMIEVDPLPVLCAGGTVCIPSSDILQDVHILAHWLVNNNVNHTLVMTSIAEALWANGIHIDLHTMLIAGERCKQWPASEYRVLNVYGSAEAAVVSIEDLSGSRRTLLPTVGRAVPGVNMYVVDSEGQELPACCIGELIITGETLSMGYLDYNESQKSFRPNVHDATSQLQYISGDRARMGLDGTVEIFGRLDALVKVRGHRVDLGEIEITALKVPGVVKAAAVSFSDNAGAIIELFIETDSNTNGVKDEVRKYLGEKLHPAAQPSQIKTMKLPLGHNGKVDYSALQSCLVVQEAQYTPYCPTTKIERILQDCWLNWTRCNKVTLESDFFMSGGDSLRAMRMMGELTTKYGIHIEMSSFLKNPVFSSLIGLANDSYATDLPKFDNQSAEQQLEPFELNEYQQALWIGRGADFNYGGVSCQGYFEWEAKDLDNARFVSALGMLVDRHSMLRVTIDETGCQKIGMVDGRHAVEFIDLSNFSPIEINDEIKKIRSRMSNEEIGITKWPLFRFVVSRISAELSRIHFCIDLLIADAWSIFQIIIPDLYDLYIKEKPELPRIQTTFRDYIVYRNKVKQSEQYRAHREYWLKKIHELPDAPKLPQLKQVESKASIMFKRHEGTLDEESWTCLKNQGQERRISPSGVVALALCEVLRYWGEQDQFTLNFPVSDRIPVSNDINLVVGDFTNPLLVPYKTTIGDTIQTRGQRLQDEIWQALDHRLFTGVEVLRELARIRRSGREPLMPVVLTSLLGQPVGRHHSSQFGRELFGVSQTPQVTLDVQVREMEGMLYFKWDYLIGAIRPDVVEAMFNSFYKVLRQLANDHEVWNRTLFEL